MFLPATSTLLLVGSAARHFMTMTGLSPGYVIPKIAGYAPGNREVLARPDGCHGTLLGSGSDSRSLVRAEYSLIYKARCKYCKSFHKPTSYCFRLNRRFVSAMGRGKHRRGQSSSSSEEEGERSDSESFSDDSGSGSEESEHHEVAAPAVPVDAGGQDAFGPPFDINLTEFYKKKKRVDAPEVKLVLRKETINLYFEELLSHGKLDKEAALMLSKKYYMGEEAFKLLAAPTLNDTKLHSIQSDAGGIYTKLLSIHVAVRNALKIFLRVFESLGGCAQAYEDYQPVQPYPDGSLLAEEFTMMTLAEAREAISDNDVDLAIPPDEEGWRSLLKDKLAQERMIERNANIHVKLVSDLDIATSVASLGKAQQSSLVDLVVRMIHFYALDLF